MSSKNNAIKNLIDAHSWLGLVISILLFLIFLAGSISLFRNEINQWAELPHHPIDLTAEDKPLLEIIEEKLAVYPLNTEEHLTIVLPGERNPYYRMAIDLLPEKENEGPENVATLKIDPKTGATMDQPGSFELATFIYALHYNLKIPFIGEYVVGVITLFFFFAILSGVFIHAKKIFANFFVYRRNRKRTKLLDMHNVVGVVSLPFSLMYAISGLVFNLLIVYQIAFAVILYQGDQEALREDAGFTVFSAPAQTGIALDMSPAVDLIKKTESRFGATPVLARFYNYGDESAVLQMVGKDKNYFHQNYQIFYRISTGEIIRQTGWENNSALENGLRVLATLHFGDFAGLDLRVLYFILGVAVAGMIIVGNMLWVNKRYQQNSGSEKVTRFVGKLTVGSCSGFVLATAVAFLAERLLPVSWENRADLVVVSYFLAVAITTFGAFRSHIQMQYIARVLIASGALFSITVVADWVMFSDAMVKLWQGGITSAVGVELGLLIVSAILFLVARRLSVTEPARQAVSSK